MRFFIGCCFGFIIGFMIASEYGMVPEMQKRLQWQLAARDAQTVARDALRLLVILDRGYKERIETLKQASACSI